MVLVAIFFSGAAWADPQVRVRIPRIQITIGDRGCNDGYHRQPYYPGGYYPAYYPPQRYPVYRDDCPPPGYHGRRGRRRHRGRGRWNRCDD